MDDDRTQHFMGTLARLCEDAALADLPVTLTLLDGSSLRGVPVVDHAAAPSDDSAAGIRIVVGETSVLVQDVRAVQVGRPAAGAGRDDAAA